MDHIALAKLSYKKNNEMLTHSEIYCLDGQKRVKVYLEKINDKETDFDTLTFEYPTCKVIENNGYSQEEILSRTDELRQWGEIAFEAEEEREEDELCLA